MSCPSVLLSPEDRVSEVGIETKKTKKREKGEREELT